MSTGGGFSIPGIMPSQVLSGAISRWRAHQDTELADHRKRRDAYIAHLGQLMNVARDGDTINWLSNEIVRVEETPDEKLPQFKGKPFPVPMAMQPPGTPAPGSGGSKAGAGAASATPPAFDFSHVMAAITGQSAVPSGDVPGQVPVTPPMPAGGLGGPFTGATPQLVPAVPAVPASSMTPPSGLPSVAMTPPGHSLPEPSPLVGTLPGTPTTPTTTPTPTPTTTPTQASITPPSFQSQFQPQFMGVNDKLQAAADIAQQHLQTTAALKAANAPDRSIPTPANMVAAARAHLVFQEAPDGTHYLRPMTAAEYTEFDRETLRQKRASMSDLGVLLDPDSTPEQRDTVWSVIKAKHQHTQRQRAPIRYTRQVLERNGKLVEVLTNPTDPGEPAIERELPEGTSKVDANKGGHLIPMADVLDRQAVRLEASASQSRYEDVKASALAQARKFRQQAAELRALERGSGSGNATPPPIRKTYKQTGTVHLLDKAGKRYDVKGGTDDGKTFYDLQTGKRLQ